MKTRYQTALVAFAETLEELDLPDAVDDQGAQREIGRRGALLGAAELQWSEHLGPLLGWREVAELLPGVGTRQGVNDLMQRKRLLGLRTKRGQVLYPLFQFPHGQPLEATPSILKAFEEADLDPWTVASWMVTPQALLDGSMPVEWLKLGKPSSKVIEAAQRSAAALEH